MKERLLLSIATTDIDTSFGAVLINETRIDFACPVVFPPWQEVVIRNSGSAVKVFVRDVTEEITNG